MTRFATPVRAPSPTPAADSMYVVLDDVDAATAGGGCERVHDEHALDAGQIALLVGEPGLLTDGGHGADSVEEIRQHQREDQQQRRQHADLGEAADRLKSPTSDRSGAAAMLSGSDGTPSSRAGSPGWPARCWRWPRR